MVSKLKGVPKPKDGLTAAGKLRPHTWCTGSDPIKHAMYHPWQVAKAQAVFRKEEWSLSFDEYYTMWLPLWDKRGRRPDDMCMTRRDIALPWDKANTQIITRSEHFKRQSERRRDGSGQFAKPGPKPGSKMKPRTKK